MAGAASAPASAAGVNCRLPASSCGTPVSSLPVTAATPGTGSTALAAKTTGRKQLDLTLGPHTSLRGKKALVVDDDQRNAFAITSILELYGLTVLQASDGKSGIDILRSERDVDIVLMDVMMPGLDGDATTATIRKLPEAADLPIIAVTAKAMRADRNKSLSAGANDYVTKPVDTEELLTCMERTLGLAATGDA